MLEIFFSWIKMYASSKHAFHRFGAGHKVGRQIAAIELHAFDPLDLGLHALAFLDRHHSVLADSVHRIRDQFPDLWIVIARNRGDLGHLLAALDLDALGLEVGRDIVHGLFDAGFQINRIDSRDHRAQSLGENGVGQHRGRRRAIAGHVVRLRGHLAHHAGAHVLVRVFQFDFLGYRDPVFGDHRGAEALIQNHVMAGRAQRRADYLREFGNASLNRFPGLLIERNHLRHDLPLQVSKAGLI